MGRDCVTAFLVATLALAGASSAAAVESAAWVACQAKATATDLDQLIDRCTGAEGCEAQAPTFDVNQVIAGCTAVIQSPSDPPLRRALAAYQRGAAHAFQGDQTHAIADFNLALGLRPDFAEAFERRGVAYAATGDDARAIADYSAAIRINPDLVAAYEARAQAFFRRRNSDLAIDDLARALNLKPDDAAALNNRCWMRAASGRDLSAALADCDAAVRLQPGAPAALDSRGFVHLKLKDYGASVADYDAALAANARRNILRASSLYGRGLARIGLGDSLAGQTDIAAAVAIAPATAQTYAGFGLTP